MDEKEEKTTDKFAQGQRLREAHGNKTATAKEEAD